MEGMGRHDPDDWFDEPETGDTWGARVDRIVREREEREDWLRESPATPEPRSRGLHVNRTYVLLGVLTLCLLLGILAAAGVFSSDSSTPTPLTTTAPTPAVAVPTAPLKPGDTGAAVVQLQKALTAAGYSPGKADGDYGDATTNAVKSFQADHGLTADGIAGSKTLAALSNAQQSG
jgi:hypothetical protein